MDFCHSNFAVAATDLEGKERNMEKNTGTPNLMLRIARMIVDKRKAVVVLFAIACIYCVASISKVNVENDLAEYLSETTETRRGLDVMEEQFTTFGTAKVLVTSITYERALELSKELEDIRGISTVSFYDADDDTYDIKDREKDYKDAAALFELSFQEDEDTALSQTAIKNVRGALEGYEAYVYTTVDKDDAAALQEDMKLISVIVVSVIVVILLFTSGTYAEIPVYLIVFGVAAVLNMGTNYWFGTISFITNAVGTILQLALAIDYAIIFQHRFMEERETLDTKEAVTVALSKAIPEISSSSLTTISGMVALMFMQFGIGRDMGQVLIKAILSSLITVFLLMPALIMMFAKAIDQTAHRNFVPSIKWWGRLIVKVRYVSIPLFLALVALAAVWSSKCGYIYDVNSIESNKKNEYIASRDRIGETFENTNVLAVIVPRESYEKEAELIDALESLEAVDTIMGLSNIEVGDNGEYILVDELNPREFSDIADVDVDLTTALYQIYAVDKEQYRAFTKSINDYRVPVIDMVDFIYEQKEKKAIDFDDEDIEDIDKLYDALCDAREQLEGTDYSRIVIGLRGAVEGEETFRTLDTIREITRNFYKESYVVGDITSNYDMSASFQSDNTMISILTALFVGIILLFTFQSASLPFILVLTIQGSIWINFSFPYLTDSTMYFLSYLIVSSIQMGATIDYAIVITSRYMVLRNELPDRKMAVAQSIDEAFPTIITSGTIMSCAGFTIGCITSNATIASLGIVLGRGTLISIILVMAVLPQLLVVFDRLIDITAFSKGSDKRERGKKSEKHEA